MNDLGKLLVIIGIVLVILGAVIWKTGGLGGLPPVQMNRVGALLRFGRLPGDITIHRGNSTFYFPIVTCLLLSAVLSLLAWLFRR